MKTGPEELTLNDLAGILMVAEGTYPREALGAVSARRFRAAYEAAEERQRAYEDKLHAGSKNRALRFGLTRGRPPK